MAATPSRIPEMLQATNPEVLRLQIAIDEVDSLLETAEFMERPEVRRFTNMCVFDMYQNVGEDTYPNGGFSAPAPAPECGTYRCFLGWHVHRNPDADWIVLYPDSVDYPVIAAKLAALVASEIENTRFLEDVLFGSHESLKCRVNLLHTHRTMLVERLNEVMGE
jgi:hypothetical protein